MINKRVAACCVAFCLCTVFANVVWAEGYTLSLPRIEAAHIALETNRQDDPFTSMSQF